MKLGSETASLTNHIFSRATRGQPVPVVGMGATILGWTDRHPATICEVISQKFIGVQEDAYVRVDSNGMSEDQDYEYTPQPDSKVYYYKLDKKNEWRPVVKNANGRFIYDPGNGLMIGRRNKYHDFSF